MARMSTKVSLTRLTSLVSKKTAVLAEGLRAFLWRRSFSARVAGNQDKSGPSMHNFFVVENSCLVGSMMVGISVESESVAL
jgi:hypothetical protein